MEKTLAEKLPESALGNDIINVPKDVSKEAEKENHLMKPYDPKSHSEYIELKRFEIEQANESSERMLRQKNAEKAFVFSARWAIFIALVILLHGFGRSYKFFILSQTEFLFVVGTLTTSIFTFYTLVLRYLFYRKPNAKTAEKKIA